MDAQERVRILELAWELSLIKKPNRDQINEASFKAWHDYFDKAYKAIVSTAEGK